MRRLNFSTLLVAALALAAASPLAGQSREMARPGRYAGPGPAKARRSELPSARYGLGRPFENALPPVTAEQIAAAPHKGILQAAGLHRKYLPDTAASGAWVSTAQGPVWRMAVRSAGAQGVRIHFQEFAAGAGKVWVHDGAADAAEIDRPYTGRGPRDDGDFWTPALFGDTAVIEYEPPAAAGEGVPFRVAEISHIFTGLDPQASSAPAAASCHLDVSCYSQWADSAKAVARMVFETSDGSFLCTGSLLMDRGKTYTPYFLTADHCISTDAEARSLTTFWFYQTSNCGGAAPNVRNAAQATGARYLTGGSMESGDFTLLQLDSVPSGVTFAGWSADPVAVGTAMTGIHHPTGDYKRISIGTRIDDIEGAFSENAHYSVAWTGGGHTEGGSSGSPLFSEPGVVVGTLTGGFKPPAGKTVCDVNPDVSVYGKFATYYPALSQYLEGRSVGGTGTGSNALTPGTPANFSYNVANPTLFGGTSAYSLDVPANASSVDIELTTDSPSAQVSVVARFGAAPTVTDGKLVADAAASTSGGRAVLHLDANSTPPIKAGKWYFGLAILTTGTTVSGKVAATVLIGGVAPPTGGTPVALTSGVTRNLSLNMIGTATFFGGSQGFKIDVPQGATRLDVHANIPNRTYSLLVRYGAEPYPVTGDFVTDFFEGNNSSYDAVVTVTPSTNPSLKAGTYYVDLLVFSDQPVVPGTLTATVQGGGGAPAGAVNLISGVPQNFSLPAVSDNTLFNGNSGYKITVPSGATKLEVKILTNTSGADLDLFVRYGSDVNVGSSGQVAADYASSGDSGGNKTVTITPSSSPALKAGTYYIAIGLFSPGKEVVGTVTATVENATSAPPAGRGPTPLISGVPANFSLPAQEDATLFSGAYGFKVTVPAGATKLTIGMAASTSADVRLIVRKDSQPAVDGGNLLADYSAAKGASTLTIDASSTPALAAGDYYIAFGVMTACAPVSGTISVNIETPRVTPPDPGGTTLDSGKAQSISLGPVSSAKLFAGDSGYKIVVPEGAQRLEIRTSATPATADIDLFVRYGSAPTVSSGSVVADFRSEGAAGDEVITITPTSTPALKAGTYYIGVALFTTNTAVKVTLTATVGSGGGSGAGGATVLTSGVAQPFSIKAATGASLIADRYQIAVPQGAKKLSIRLVTSTPGVDLDLYARFGQDLEIQDRKVVADFDSSGDTGNELIEITPSSSPALKAGTYFIGMAIFTKGVAASGTLTATVETDSSSSATVLTSGVGQRFSLPAVSGTTLMSRDGAFRIDVPAGATQLKVMATGSQMNVNFYVCVRYGQPPEVANGKVVADFQSTSGAGDERVIITPTSTPALRAGTYYMTLLLTTPNKAATGTITATVEAGSTAPPGSTKLTSGLPAKFSLPSVDGPTLFTGDYGFQIDVPQGATRLQIKLNTTTPNVDTDLYVRYGSDVDLTSSGDVIADFDSSGDTGDESIVITSASSKPLQAGTYFIGFGLFTEGVAAEGKITATVESAPSLPGGDSGTKLEPGVKTPFSLEPVSQATLFTGGRGFLVTVPSDATKLQIDVATTTAGADVDLFVAYGAMPDVVDGRVTADYRSATSSGNESVAVTRYSTPPLKAGTYYIGLAVFTLDTTVEGTVTATLSSTQSEPAELQKLVAAREPEAKAPVIAAIR